MAINLTKGTEVSKKKNDEITYNVLEECGTCATKEYTKKGQDVTEELKLRYMSWNNGEPRYDLRWWSITDEGERCGKGVGFPGEALIALGEIINALQSDSSTPNKRKK